LELEGVFESEEVTALEFVLKKSFPSPRVPEFGNFKASRAEGTVIFVDITGSTKYFQKEDGICYIDNYTGFVIFNSYILLIKSITKVFGGEFLEHTGDGAMLFFENKDFICEYENYTEFFKEPIGLCFLAGEKLKEYAKRKNLIKYDCKPLKNNIYWEPSLVHIGASFGKVLQVHLGEMKKLISKTVWEAADRCKRAGRKVKYEVRYLPYSKERKIYFELPIKCS
jgi:hypothetical protein